MSAINEHTVVKGETLWSIAENSYGSGYNWVDIKKANNLTNDTIEVGQKLVMPDDVATNEPTATLTSQAQTDSQQLSITGDVYTVVKGDCLWDIAVKAYGDGFAWTKIAQANNLDNPNIIHPGNSLILPR